MLVEEGADAVADFHFAERARVAEFAREGGDRRVYGLHAAVAAHGAPVLAAAALVVAAESEEHPRAVDPQHLRDDRSFGIPLGNDHFLLRRMGLEAWARAVFGGVAFEVRAEFGEPHRPVWAAALREECAERIVPAGKARRFEVGVDVEDVGVLLEFVGGQAPAEVGIWHVGERTEEDRLCGIGFAHGKGEHLEGRDVLPDGLRDHLQVGFVPEAPGVVGVAEGRDGVRHERPQREEVGRQVALAGDLAAGVGWSPGEDAGGDKAVGSEVSDVGEAAAVVVHARRGVHAVPRHALARLHDAALAHKLADHAEGIAAVPRAIEGARAVRKGRIRRKGGVGVAAGVAARDVERAPRMALRGTGRRKVVVAGRKGSERKAAVFRPLATCDFAPAPVEEHPPLAVGDFFLTQSRRDRRGVFDRLVAKQIEDRRLVLGEGPARGGRRDGGCRGRRVVR